MDIALIETGNGGDIKIVGNDLASQGGWGNMPYIGMFGGNYNAVTKKRISGEIVSDWWGNQLLIPENSSAQFNSTTERLLNATALDSSGRVFIEQAVKQDLSFMQVFADITVKVTILSDDKLKIFITVRQKQGVSDLFREYIFLWDNTKQELIGDFSIFDFNDDFFV